MVATTIAEQVAAMHAKAAAHPPNEAMDAFARERKERAAAGVPAGAAAPVGARVPDADLLDVHGQPTTLYAAMQNRPA